MPQPKIKLMTRRKYEEVQKKHNISSPYTVCCTIKQMCGIPTDTLMKCVSLYKLADNYAIQCGSIECIRLFNKLIKEARNAAAKN